MATFISVDSFVINKQLLSGQNKKWDRANKAEANYQIKHPDFKLFTSIVPLIPISFTYTTILKGFLYSSTM